MRVLLWIMLLFSLLVSGASAQDDPSRYRLRVPTATEYLAAVPGALAAYREELPDYYGKSPYQPMVDVIAEELAFRYSDAELFDQRFDLLASAYSAIRNDVSFYNISDPLDLNGVAMDSADDPRENSSPDWLIAMLKAWLRENPVDLAEVEEIEIPGFEIDASQLDLNHDTNAEYILDFRGWSYNTLLVLNEDASLPEGYRFIETPLPMFYETLERFTVLMTLQIGDLNSDDDVEWVIFAHAGDSQSWVYEDCGRLYVLSWPDNRLVDLISSEDPFLCMPDPVEFVNLDNDPDLEIRQNNPDGDYWYCRWHIAKIFDWDGQHFGLISEEKVFDGDTLGCALHQAEPLMWENKFDAAIPFYEHGLEVGWNTEYDVPDEYTVEQKASWYVQLAEMYQYAQFRLALAYALAGRSDDASILMAELESSAAESEVMETLIQAVLTHSHSATTQCTAAYNVFWNYQQSTFDYDLLPSNIRVGGVELSCCPLNVFPPDPEKAGCNIIALIDELLETKLFDFSETPVQQLETLDVEVEHHVQVDLNTDNRDDWLVWPVAQVGPILFVSGENAYQVSRPDVSRPDNDTQFTIQTTPDGQTVLVDWSGSNSGSRCTGASNHYAVGSMKLWRINGTELENILKMPLCESREIDSIFQNEVQELYGWAIQFDAEFDYEDEYGPAVYTWDAELKNYVAPKPQPKIEHPEIYIEGQGYVEPDESLEVTVTTDVDLFQAISEARRQYSGGDLLDTVDVLADAITNSAPEVNPIALNGARYWHGFLLETLNQPDDALAEYIAIYEAAPESAWGMLAALHLEGVEG